MAKKLKKVADLVETAADAVGKVADLIPGAGAVEMAAGLVEAGAGAIADKLAEPECEPEPRRRMTGDELKAHLRQQRREQRLADRGY
jgi:hypothetical protein